ncbi:hypothetical protein M514_06210 [Trichuris suis]|uniref:Uncharacterized protein n=1 Tax=Trichuris suis TaxID=68888 RepID=A0A085N2L8_9BILA|nr:hypothetical protein M513_06210 [Trichuris suis]KFD63714.1 hypothetical protein M514_06210 [Trichuris suis]
MPVYIFSFAFVPLCGVCGSDLPAFYPPILILVFLKGVCPLFGCVE